RTTLLRSGSFIEFGENSDPLHRSGNLIYEYAAPFLHKRSLTEKIRLFIINTFEESLELGLMVILTAAIAVAIQVFIPQSYFFEQASSPLPQTLLMMGWGFFVSLGSMTSITFIQPYLGHFWNGALLAYLLLGSVLNLKSWGLLLITFRIKPLFYFSILVIQLIFLFALGLNYYLS
ncbi:MAG: permease, partial [Microcystaceae cyanobacterium]